MFKNRDRQLLFWILLMKLGFFSGCHQKASRSFFAGNYQFPVCARCTGVFVGYILYACISKEVGIELNHSILFCIVMLVDWLLQYLKIRESTNFRRFVTGIFGGYGFLHILLSLISLVNI